MTNEAENNHTPERPLECGECRKPIKVKYTEVTDEGISHLVTCIDCPLLVKKLSGNRETEDLEQTREGAGLCCGSCGLTLEALRTGSKLGCAECYEVFDMPILQELIKADKIPEKLRDAALKSAPNLHKGHAPGEVKEVSPSIRLLALNEALNEMLSREDYEQAAWLRDQIKELTDQHKSNEAE